MALAGGCFEVVASRDVDLAVRGYERPVAWTMARKFLTRGAHKFLAPPPPRDAPFGLTS